MTIAVCCVTPEGVVLGSDSTSTIHAGTGIRFLNHEQKLFEVGSGSTIGIVTWGLGSFVGMSFRTLIAQFGDTLSEQKPERMRDVASAWAAMVWPHYKKAIGKLNAQKLLEKLREEATPDDERIEIASKLDMMELGFCIGGHCGKDRTPAAMELAFNVMLEAPPEPVELKGVHYWGISDFIIRLLGTDGGYIAGDVLKSGQWTGTKEDLVKIFSNRVLRLQNNIPIREAADLVHTLIYATIKFMKFTFQPPHCGGPIEIAAITTDRPFRWIKHKELGTAIG